VDDVDKPQRRPFQFSLLKLMLGMAVCAAYFDIMRRVGWLGPPWSASLFVNMCVGMIVVLTIKLEFKQGLIVTACVSAVSFIFAPFITSPILLFGLAQAVYTFLLVSMLVWLVDKADALVKTKPPKGQ